MYKPICFVQLWMKKAFVSMTDSKIPPHVSALNKRKDKTAMSALFHPTLLSDRPAGQHQSSWNAAHTHTLLIDRLKDGRGCTHLTSKAGAHTWVPISGQGGEDGHGRWCMTADGWHSCWQSGAAEGRTHACWPHTADQRKWRVWGCAGVCAV